MIRTPIQAPNANAFAERWVRTVRSDCLDRILILGRTHLERPDGGDVIPVNHTRGASAVRRQDLLGGLIHEYRQAA